MSWLAPNIKPACEAAGVRLDVSIHVTISKASVVIMTSEFLRCRCPEPGTSTYVKTPSITCQAPGT